MARTRPRRKTDDYAFPVRVRFRDREPGPDWIRWSEAETWLVENVGRGHFAKHGDGGQYDIYFRTPEAAHLFLIAFPHLKLFDMTEQVDYLRAAQSGSPVNVDRPAETRKVIAAKVAKRASVQPNPVPLAVLPLNLPDLRREVDNISGGKGAFQDVTQPRDFRAFMPAPPDARLKDVGPVRAHAERMSFGRWLLSQKDRGDWIDGLAAAARLDRAFPKEGTADDLRKRLQEMGAEGDMFEALDDAEMDWLSY